VVWSKPYVYSILAHIRIPEQVLWRTHPGTLLETLRAPGTVGTHILRRIGLYLSLEVPPLSRPAEEVLRKWWTNRRMA